MTESGVLIHEYANMIHNNDRVINAMGKLDASNS